MYIIWGEWQGLRMHTLSNVQEGNVQKEWNSLFNHSRTSSRTEPESSLVSVARNLKKR